MRLIILSLLLISNCVFGFKGVNSMSIKTKTLSNGLTIIVKSNHTVPKVSMQLWFRVGSKDEQTNEKGIAHLIEHMIFKGTKQMLSESDINVIVHMLSGDCNAFTSYDYTGYKFNMPTHHWQQMFPIMADCMSNAAFKDEHLNSEMKAVIQELKMIKDSHARQMVYDLFTTIFPDHPYHYPLIGYKDDLWSVSGKDLERFYKKYYCPNNAVLVVVGDIDAQQVFQLAEQTFGDIPASDACIKQTFYHDQDIASKSITHYRDVQQPIGVAAFVVPGATAKMAHLVDVLSLILGGGKSSRLYKRLIDQERLVTSVSVSSIDLFDHGLFFILYTPKDAHDVADIERAMQQEIDKIVSEGIAQDELQSVLVKAKMHEYAVLESNEMQAYLIGQYYLATNDPNYVFTYLDVDQDLLSKQVVDFCQRYFRPSIRHRGLVLPLLNEYDKQEWIRLQKLSDQKDNAILSARQRVEPVEPAKYANSIKVFTGSDFDFPKAQICQLESGLKLLWYHNDQTPKINIMVQFKAESYFDSQDKQGLLNFMARMMSEGTKHYTAEQLAHELESRGINMEVYPGGISLAVLRDDLEKALELLKEILTACVFPKDKIEKVRTQLFATLKQFWDTPLQFAGQLVAEIIYKDHPYSKNALGSFESIEKITQEDLLESYNKYIVPDGTNIAIVGDLSAIDIEQVFKSVLGDWSGSPVVEPEFPKLEKPQKRVTDFPINRDQIVLVFAGLSIDRYHPDHDKLLLFDQIFSGGGLNSKLMKLREQTGLFYSISGSTIGNAGKQPGMVTVRTMVSVDRLAEAQTAIVQLLDSVVDTITEQELQEAKNAVAHGLIGFFDSNVKIASIFLYLQKFGLPQDYCDYRARNLAAITLQEVKDAAKRHLRSENMSLVRIGRLDSN